MKLDFKKPLTKNQKISFVLLFSLIIIWFPQILFVTRKNACEFSQPKRNDLCWALMSENNGPGIGKPEIERSGYYLKVRPVGSADFTSTTYNLLTGKVSKKCGFWIGFATQGSPCATPEELEKSQIR